MITTVCLWAVSLVHIQGEVKCVDSAMSQFDSCNMTDLDNAVKLQKDFWNAINFQKQRGSRDRTCLL